MQRVILDRKDVCPSVRLSVTLVNCDKTNAYSEKKANYDKHKVDYEFSNEPKMRYFTEFGSFGGQLCQSG